MIVEDHPLFSKGLASLITGNMGKYVCTVVGEAVNLSEAMKIAQQEKPSLAIVDISLGEESGIDLIPRLKSLDPNMAILVLSMHDERCWSERVLHAGAQGYIMKTEPPQKVLDAIKTVISGKIYLSNNEQERVLKAMTGKNQREVKDEITLIRKLSDREFQVFSCMGKGMGTVEIASKFKISSKTIDTHKEHIKLKLHCDSSYDLRRLAIEWVNHPDLLYDKENP